MFFSYVPLPWDTDTFGFRTATIVLQPSGTDTLAQVVKTMQEDRYILGYLSVDVNDTETCELAVRNGGFLASQNITYVARRHDMLFSTNEMLPNERIVITSCFEVDSGLTDLALQSGEFSRYRKDPRFPAKLFEKMYWLWISRSVKREIAKEVFVAHSGPALAGLVTLGAKKDSGVIGLFAVEKIFRKMGIGYRLLQHAHKWFIENHYDIWRVVTQADNIAACSLYQKCGYKRESAHNIYHFWTSNHDHIQ